MRFKKYLSILLSVLIVLACAGCENVNVGNATSITTTESLTDTQTTIIETTISADTSTSSSNTETTVTGIISTTSPDTVIINGVEYDKDITVLDLSNPVDANTDYSQFYRLTAEDIEPLKYLTKLEELNLRGNRIDDINILAYCPNLIKLNISYNPLKSLSGLESSKNLTEIIARNTSITNIDILINNSKMGKMDLTLLAIEDLNVLKNFDNLQYLDISSSRVTDINGLEFTPHLKFLDLSSNGKIKDFSPILNLKELEELNIMHQDIDLKYLANLKNLKKLIAVDVNEDFNSEIMKSMPNLVYLDISFTYTRGFSFLEFIPGLEYLGINRVYFENLNDIHLGQEIRELEMMEIGDTADLAPLSSLKNLEKVSISYLRADFTPLSKCHNLTDIYFFDCVDLDDNYLNLESFGSLTKLKSLKLEDCWINNIDFIKSLTSLEELIIGENACDNVSALKDLQKLKNLDLGTCYKEIDLSALTEIDSLEKIKVVFMPDVVDDNSEYVLELDKIVQELSENIEESDLQFYY